MIILLFSLIKMKIGFFLGGFWLYRLDIILWFLCFRNNNKNVKCEDFFVEGCEMLGCMLLLR